MCICILMCEALPPTLEKNNMDLGVYMSIYGYILLFVFQMALKGGRPPEGARGGEGRQGRAGREGEPGDPAEVAKKLKS